MSQDNSGEINEEDKLTPEEVQELEIGIPSFMKRKPGRYTPSGGIDETKIKEQYEERMKVKKNEYLREDLAQKLASKLDEESGGVSSKLNPVNPKSALYDETVPYVPDPTKISNN